MAERIGRALDSIACGGGAASATAADMKDGGCGNDVKRAGADGNGKEPNGEQDAGSILIFAPQTVAEYRHPGEGTYLEQAREDPFLWRGSGSTGNSPKIPCSSGFSSSATLCLGLQGLRRLGRALEPREGGQRRPGIVRRLGPGERGLGGGATWGSISQAGCTTWGARPRSEGMAGKKRIYTTTCVRGGGRGEGWLCLVLVGSDGHWDGIRELAQGSHAKGLVDRRLSHVLVSNSLEGAKEYLFKVAANKRCRTNPEEVV